MMKNFKLIIALLATLMLAASLASAFVLFNPPGKWLSGDLPRNIEINQIATVDFLPGFTQLFVKTDKSMLDPLLDFTA